MNNVWTIFKNDLKHLGKNSISWVVVIGLIVIPSLYSWLCVYAFWDPYNNTDNLKVAVASVDEGYESSLVPVQLNLGKEILQELADNRQLDWVFLDRKDAVEGVRSGKYYAALVIPKDFSRNLLSILSDDVQSAEILYYINEKENAIAAKVSSQGASTIQNTIDEVVAETAAGIALNSLGTLSDVLEDQDTREVVESIRQKMQGFSVKLDSSADTMDRLCEMNTTLNSLLKATDDLLTEMGANTSAAVQDLESTDQSFSSLESDLNVMNAKMDTVLQNTEQVYTGIDNAAAQYLSDMNADASTFSQSMNTWANRIQTITGRYQELQNNVQSLSDSLPSELNISRMLLNDISVSLDRSIRQQNQVYDSLVSASSELSGVSSDAVRYQGELSGYLTRCAQDMKNMRDRFHRDVQPQILELSDSLSQTKQSAKTVTEGLAGAASDMNNVGGSVSGQMDQLNQNLISTRDLLRDAAEKIRGIQERIDGEDESGVGDILKNLMNNDTDTVSSYISSVVQLDSHILYPVENFGSAIAPFYTSLAIWVGAVILMAMLKVTVSEKQLALLSKVRNWQLYLGRFGIFLLLAVAQCLLLSAGELYYLGVQCAHPALFILTCIYLGIVFVTMVYTLTATFGNVGKAVVVILMVFQVAGSGGTIPIEMTPPFFHIFYPLLPVTHSMTALRECIAGLYGNTYYMELGILSIYIWISLLLGLVLRNLMINMNRKFVQKVESTKVM